MSREAVFAAGKWHRDNQPPSTDRRISAQLDNASSARHESWVRATADWRRPFARSIGAILRRCRGDLDAGVAAGTSPAQLDSERKERDEVVCYDHRHSFAIELSRRQSPEMILHLLLGIGRLKIRVPPLADSHNQFCWRSIARTTVAFGRAGICVIRFSSSSATPGPSLLIDRAASARDTQYHFS
jgi:hypothetical protein